MHAVEVTTYVLLHDFLGNGRQRIRIHFCGWHDSERGRDDEVTRLEVDGLRRKGWYLQDSLLRPVVDYAKVMKTTLGHSLQDSLASFPIPPRHGQLERETDRQVTYLGLSLSAPTMLKRRPSSEGDENPAPAKLPTTPGIGLSLARNHCRAKQELDAKHTNCAHRNWQRLSVTDPSASEGHAWLSFHQKWWNTKELGQHWDMATNTSLGDGVIHVGERDMFDGLLRDTNGTFLLREELLFTCKRFDDTYRENPDSAVFPGVVLSGQPGIGASRKNVSLVFSQLKPFKENHMPGYCFYYFNYIGVRLHFLQRLPVVFISLTRGVFGISKRSTVSP